MCIVRDKVSILALRVNQQSYTLEFLYDDSLLMFCGIQLYTWKPNGRNQ